MLSLVCSLFHRFVYCYAHLIQMVGGVPEVKQKYFNYISNLLLIVIMSRLVLTCSQSTSALTT